MTMNAPFADETPKSRPLTGRHVLLFILAFFGVIITVNMVFLTFAMRTFPGESMKKSYLQGLHYNDILEERAAQAALGWRAEIVRAERVAGDGVIELQLFDEAGAPLTALRVTGELRRPAHSRDDRPLTFAHRGEGAYRASAGALDAGVWALTVQAEGGEDEILDVTGRLEFQ